MFRSLNLKLVDPRLATRISTIRERETSIGCHGHVLMSPSGNCFSQTVQQVLYLRVAAAAAFVLVTHQQLVAEDRRQDLRAVVAEATMPRVLVQFERPLERADERLDGQLAPRVQR